MYHGGYHHGGNAGTNSTLDSTTVNDRTFGLLKSINLEGSILSVPAVVDGFIYVGVANSHNKAVKASNGGTIYKVDITTGDITAQYSWQLQPGEGDAHGFYGMGCTPTVINGLVYFSAFNGHVYCLKQSDLSYVWDTDLRNADSRRNQPISNTAENIAKNIFKDPVMLKSYANHIGSLSSGVLGKVIKFFKPTNPKLAEHLWNLRAQLRTAQKNDQVKDADDLEDAIAEAIAQGILAERLNYADFFLKTVLPMLGLPVAAGWCSPLVVNFGKTSRVYVGVAEGENPLLFGFVYALDGLSGNLEWVYCTTQNKAGVNNPVNQIPAPAIDASIKGAPHSYTTVDGFPVCMGCSVWSAIAYDSGTGLVYASTGNPQPDGALPTPGYSNGIIALNAETGDFKAFQQMPKDTAYRDSDIDVDIGSACTLFEFNGSTVVSVSCKNGGYMVCDAETLEIIHYTKLLPYMNDGSQIPQIDPHPPYSQQNELSPQVTNEVSNANPGENYFGPFNTAAVIPATPTEDGKIFIGIGGPNYHNQGPGIDYKTTPFMKALNMSDLSEAWPMDSNDPPRYSKVGASMYTNAGESGLSSPAVVNDVVFCSTSKIAIYAFSAADGSLLWSRNIGSETQGYNGGYGYCLGPAIWGDYVVAGGLILGQSGGILEIYGPKSGS